jgi:NAD(P)-dependent dehydrogenase (short-subunit alcohol dehydrogenase family)
LSADFYAQPGVEQARSTATASGRVGEPEDIAHVTAFLASPRSAYVNAADILVDGGMSSKLMDMVPRPGFSQTR